MSLSDGLFAIDNVSAEIFDAIGDGVCVCDLQGRIVYMNRAMADGDALLRDQLYGSFWMDLFDFDPQDSPILRAIRERRTVTREGFTYRLGETEVTRDCAASPLVEDGRVVGAYLIVKRAAAEPRKAAETAVKKRTAVKSSANLDLIGESPVFADCRRTALKAAKSNSAVMLVGATGTGKEVFARTIHQHSDRRDGPFLAVNCAAIPENLLEGILFGTTKGVYTGAVEREGLFLQAKGGTVFLDEMNSMPLASQAKLLRVLEEKTVYKLGSGKGEPIDVRVISSSNELPQAAVERGILRRDLFYRLSVVYIRIPSLMERREDIPLLVSHFISRYNRRFHKNVIGVADEVMDFFQSFPWPGNVRQLKHAIESAMNFTENGQGIGFSALPTYLFEDGSLEETPLVPVEPPPRAAAAAKTVMEDIHEREREEIAAALREAKGNMAAAARALGMTRQALVYRVKKYGLK
ncbi:MAG: sigma-54 interaction domain-containing protein [Bacillota bacterium]